jgi:transposase
MAATWELTDEEWSLVVGIFDPPGRRGPKAKRDRRTMVEAVLWLARTGAQWRELPERFGPWPGVWSQWRRWRDSGVWAQAMEVLRRDVRLRAGRDPEPSLLMVDAQTTKGRRAGPGFHERGGAGGRTRGTKRTVIIDVLGLPVAAKATSARPHDSTVGRALLDEVLPEMPRVSLVMADQGYRTIAEHVAAEHLVMFEWRAWEEKPAEGFKPIRPLWRVEDAFARLGAWRRMSRCFEATAAGASTWLEVACVGVLLARRRQMLAVPAAAAAA